MRDDYLWDRSGEVDPETRRLEELLGGLRSRRPAPELPEPGQDAGLERPGSRPGWRRSWVPLAAAATIAAAALGLWAWRSAGAAALTVTRLEGQPRIGARPVGAEGRLRVGQHLETDGASRARIAIGMIGDVEVGPGSAVGLVESGDGVHRLSMSRGVIEARIWAPPRRFFVETPSAVAVDLGCAYMLRVEPDGAGVLAVRSGWVGFDRDGLESLIPAGAMCLTRPGSGPGTPFYEDAAPELKDALRRLDFEAAEPAAREALLEEIAARARPRDALTLWHLLVRLPARERERVFDALARAVPPPAGVTREGALAGDRGMLESWWDEMGLGNTQWWRLWKLPDPPV